MESSDQTEVVEKRAISQGETRVLHPAHQSCLMTRETLLWYTLALKFHLLLQPLVLSYLDEYIAVLYSQLGHKLTLIISVEYVLRKIHTNTPG